MKKILAMALCVPILLTTNGKEFFTMKMYFSRNIDTLQKAETELTTTSLQEAIEKTRRALDIAYAGFDNAVEFDLIDSYIYEMNALQKR